MKLYDSILITGGGGMLARALADGLRSRGLSPKVLSRQECDVANPVAVASFFASPPTLFLNCAAHTKVDLCESESEKADAVNGRAVGTIADLCRRHGTFLVHVSTDFVFDGSATRPYQPDDPVNPLSAYGRSKLLGERLLRESALSDWLLVRTAWVYGRGGANFPRTMVTAARAGKPLAVVNDQIGSPTYTVDLADAILELLDAGSRGIYHVTNSGQTTWHEFAVATLADFGIAAPVALLSSAQWQQMRPASAIRPAYSVLNTDKFIAAAGRPMRHWREALKDFAAAVQQDGF
jgi:dTDP-4-dehydrorhamnose reductase